MFPAMLITKIKTKVIARGGGGSFPELLKPFPTIQIVFIGPL